MLAPGDRRVSYGSSQAKVQEGPALFVLLSAPMVSRNDRGGW
jgi:hypothetical protein